MMKLDPKPAETLWAVHITGPDDIIPVAGYLDAVRVANTFNAWWQAQKTSKSLHEYDPRMWASPLEWDRDPERHAEWVASPSPDYAAFITPPLSTITPAEVGGHDETLRQLDVLYDRTTQGSWRTYQNGVHPAEVGGMGSGDDYAICTHGPKSFANADWIATMHDEWPGIRARLKALSTALSTERAAHAETKRERDDAIDALEEIFTLSERPYEKFPADWRDKIAACPECKRYADHPIQSGICDEHRRPLYAREDHDKNETKILGYRAKGIARDALARRVREGGKVDG